MTDTSDNPSDNQSLRYAINNAASNDQIQFNLPANSIITLNSANGPLTINRNLTITGPGASNLKIDGGHTTGSTGTEVFSISSGATVAISSLTIADGYSSQNGGGIVNNGSLTVSDSTLSGNYAPSGGGIYNLGSLSVSDCTLSGNGANPTHHSGQYFGGGIYNKGNVTVSDSTLSGNYADYSGGIYNLGSLSVSDSTVSGNYGSQYGTIYNDGILTVSDSTLSGNYGNGIYNSGTLTLSDSTLYRNYAYQGGGIYSDFGSSVILTNVTVADNSASSAGGGIYIHGGTVTLHNSLVAGNLVGSNASDVTGSLDSASDYNLIGDGSGGLNPANHNLLGSPTKQLDPLLWPLGKFGGQTQTMALEPGSPAIDAGSSAYASPTDQRGLNRVGAPDIGAFESQGFAIAVSSGNNQSATILTAFANPLVVSVTANNPVEPVQLGQVTFTAPSSGASAILSSNPPGNLLGVIDSTGKASVLATANILGGAYTVSASANGVARPASFNLANTADNTEPPTLVVTTTSDENNPYDGTISLREAIEYAEALTGPQTISFDPNVTGTINLGSALPDLTGNITIDGPGAGVLNVHGSSSAYFSVFTVSAGATAAIDALTISGGSAFYGGGIYDLGSLSVIDSTLSGNSARNSGGGIYNLGSLSVIDSILSGNSAGNSGGGIYNSGALQLQGVTLKSNQAKGYNGIGTNRTRFGMPVGAAGGDAYGGGLYVAGGTVSLTNDTLSDNHAQGGNGFGAFLGDIGGAGGNGYGGGLYVQLGTVSLTNDSLSGNIADGGNGGAGGIGPTYVGSGGVGGTGSGGCVFVAGGSIILTNNTLSGNGAQGGKGGTGGNGGIRSSNGPGGPGGTGGNASGGGVYAAVGSITLTNDTLSDNNTQGGNGGYGGNGGNGGNGGYGGNGGNGSGGGLFIPSGSTTTLRNALIAGDKNTAGAGGAGGSGKTNGVSGTSGSASDADVSGNVASSDHDLIGDGSGSNLSNGTNGDLVGTSANPINPLLAPLGNYGGPTQTMALLPGSPAIDAGSSAYGGSTDQRGQPRVGATDIGAFESQGCTLAVSSGNNQSTVVKTPFGKPLVVTVTANNAVEPVAGGLVTFAAPPSGASAVLSGSPASIDKNGNASVTATANGTPGNYTVTTSASGVASSASFSLSNLEALSLVVTTLSDENNPSDGTISLREAIAYAETLSGTQTITFATGLAGTIDLLSALPDLKGNVTIQGLGANVVTVKRTSTAPFSDFTVDAGATATISGLTISGGSATYGGAIHNSGTLTVNDCTLSGNTASTGGGGIANYGSLTVSGGTLSGNSAGESGGGVYNSGTLQLQGVKVKGNEAKGYNGGSYPFVFGYGGGLYVAGGSASLSNDVLSGNRAQGGSGGSHSGDGGWGGSGLGGGMYVSKGTVILTNDILSGNNAQGGNGGNGANGTISAVYGGFGGSGGYGYGGGMFVAGGSITLTSDIFSGNNARGGKGGKGGNLTFNPLHPLQTGIAGAGGLGGHGSGGGVFVTGGSVTLTNDTLSGNNAQGGNGGNGGNGGDSGMGSSHQTGGYGGSGGDGSGGGVHGTVVLTNDTLSGNNAQGGNGGDVGFGQAGAGTTGGNGGKGSGGGLFAGKAALRNTLIAANNTTAGAGGAGGGHSGSVVGPDVSGNVASSDHDLIGDGTGSNLTNGINSDLVGTTANPINPLLAPLGNYGGPTQTMALLPGSPAIDAGNSAYVGSTDQRGQPRVGATDIGSFESQGFSIAVSSGNTQSAALNTAFDYPLIVSVTAINAVEPAAGGLVTFTAPTSGASAVLSGSPASIDKNGNARVTATANGTPGSYTVTTSASGVASPASFSLGNSEAPSLVVTTLSDENNPSDGTISLREAIAYAETLTGPQSISFAPGLTGTIDLLSAMPDLTGNITIQGPSANVLTVQRDASAAQFSVFTVDVGATAAFSGLTIADGYGTAGGGIDNNGSLTLSDSTLFGNSATINGGGLYNSGNLVLSNCTLSGNAANYGGGIDSNSSSPVTLTNDTLANNSATTAGGGIDAASGDVMLHNTLIAGNTAGGKPSDVSGNLDPSSDYNLIGDSSGSLNPANHNLLGTSTNLLDPLLAPLSNYGGPTQTMALLPGSTAIDAGSSAYGGNVDQRGQPRVGATDIGAFESQGFTISVSSGNNQNTAVNTAFANPLVVTVTANNSAEPVAGGRVTFTAPSTGASAVLSGSPASIDSKGQASVTATANATGGIYTVDAAAAGVASPVNFSLSNEAPPSVSIMPLASVAAGSSVSAQGSFAEANGSAYTPYSYSWTATNSSGAVVMSLSGQIMSYPASGPASVPSFNFTPAVAGTYTVQLVVTDENNLADSASQPLTVSSPVSPPPPPPSPITFPPSVVSQIVTTIELLPPVPQPELSDPLGELFGLAYLLASAQSPQLANDLLWEQLGLTWELQLVGENVQMLMSIPQAVSLANAIDQNPLYSTAAGELLADVEMWLLLVG